MIGRSDLTTDQSDAHFLDADVIYIIHVDVPPEPAIDVINEAVAHVFRCSFVVTVTGAIKSQTI